MACDEIPDKAIANKILQQFSYNSRLFSLQLIYWSHNTCLSKIIYSVTLEVYIQKKKLCEFDFLAT